MKLLILLIFFVPVAFGKVSYFDYIKNNQSKKINLSQKCLSLLKKKNIQRDNFYSQTIANEGVRLDSLQFKSTFFHYTKASVLQKILRSDIADREKAQSVILKEGGYKSILEHSLSSKEQTATPGLYVAANSESSKDYGPIQIQYKLKPDSVVLVDFGTRLLKAESEKIKTEYLENRNDCNDLDLQVMLAQESGVQMIYYLESMEWFVIIDDSIIERSSISL